MASDRPNFEHGDRFLYNLTLLFIGLKLTGYIDWSWWYVLSPVPLMLLTVVAVIGVFEAILLACGKK
jgi:hypothetical protein